MMLQENNGRNNRTDGRRLCVRGIAYSSTQRAVRAEKQSQFSSK
jgi:hypothetical protein